MSVNPLHLFLCSIALSAFTAVGALLLSDGQKLTVRSISAVILFHGLVGGGLGMAAYEYLELRESPWVTLAIAIGYGAGVIQLGDLRTIFRRVLRSLVQTDKHESNK